MAAHLVWPLPPVCTLWKFNKPIKERQQKRVCMQSQSKHSCPSSAPFRAFCGTCSSDFFTLRVHIKWENVNRRRLASSPSFLHSLPWGQFRFAKEFSSATLFRFFFSPHAISINRQPLLFAASFRLYFQQFLSTFSCGLNFFSSQPDTKKKLKSP